MIKHIFFVAILSTLFFTSGCNMAKPTSPDPLPPVVDSNTALDDALSDDTNSNTPYTIFDYIDVSHRIPLVLSSENTEGYHETLVPVKINDINITPDMILEEDMFIPLVQHLVTTPYNYTLNTIAYLQPEDSIYLLSNKLNHLPEDYIPQDLTVPSINFYFEEFHEKRQLRAEAAQHIEQLFTAALEEEDYTFLGVSGYRSYRTQNSIYTRNVANRGQEATDKISARPGHSEHQTGLVLDVTLHELNYRLVEELGNREEGIWLQNNAHRFGFIIRYPLEDEAITGYSYEPWHLRYVGKDIATFIYEHDITLEELYMYIEFLIEKQAPKI